MEATKDRKSIEEQIKEIEKKTIFAGDEDHERYECYSLLSRWVSLKELKKKGMQTTDLQAYFKFFEMWFKDSRVCPFSRNLMEFKGSGWANVDLSILKSVMYDFGFSKNHIEDNLANWIAGQTPQLLIDLPQPDGIDHIKQIAESITVKDLSVDQVTEILKQWMSGVWKRYLDNNKQNYFLLFRGDQGIGKDWLIRLLNEPLDLYAINFTMQSQERDVFDQVTSALVVNISEFDQTEKYNPAFLKDLITKYKATYRQAYGRNIVTKNFHCSFIGTTNQQYVMRDETGSRRFIILDIEAMDRDKMKAVNYAQAWSQARLLSLNYEWSDDVRKIITNKMELETPDNDLEQNIVELWNERINLELRSRQIQRLIYSQVVPIFDAIRKDLGLRSVKPIQQCVKKFHGQQRVAGVRYYKPCSNPWEGGGPDSSVAVTAHKISSNLPNYALLIDK